MALSSCRRHPSLHFIFGGMFMVVLQMGTLQCFCFTFPDHTVSIRRQTDSCSLKFSNCKHEENKCRSNYLIQEATSREERLNVLAFRHARLIPTISQYMEKNGTDEETAINELAEKWLDDDDKTRALTQFYAWEPAGNQPVVGAVDAEIIARSSSSHDATSDEIQVELKNLRVDVSARRHGIGRALVQAVQQYAQQQIRQPSIVYLDVDDDNTGAISLYQQMGFCTDSNNRNRMVWSAK